MALPQPLHIFRKDLRHLWPESLIVLALFAAFIWSAPSRWTDSPYATFAPILSGFLKLLMPISWFIVISRLVHDEPPVGDRQFWTSRPYHWATLLAAKLLYIAAFLYLPFLLMQVYLLKHAGLYPSLAVPALLHNLLLLTVIVVIPLTAIAAVTGTFARMLLSVLGALLYIVILGLLFAFLSFQHMAPPALKPILVTLFIVLPAVALVYQYATRKTLNSRLMLAATPLIIFGLMLLTPAAALIRGAYPTFADASTPKLSSIPDEYAAKSPKPGPLFTFKNQALISLPATVTGSNEKEFYDIAGTAINVTPPGGSQYSGPYMSSVGQSAGQIAGPIALISFPIPTDVLNSLKGAPTDVHFSVAAEHFKVGNPQLWRATLLPFSVPHHGLCAYSQENPDLPPTCRFAFEVPESTFVSAPLAVQSCTAQPGQPDQKVTGGARLQQQGSAGFSLDFDPVVTAPLSLRPRQQVPPGINLVLCPGTELSFVEAKSQGKGRFEFDQKQIVLENYAAHIPPPNSQPAQPSLE